MHKKTYLYCQIGGAIDMAEFSIKGKYGALQNSGLDPSEIGLIFICWKTPSSTYDWLKANNFDYVDMEYDEGKGFLWNLYKGWNLGHEVCFSKGADSVCPIATDHAFYKNWLFNLRKHLTDNRIVNCKLIEPGSLPSLHTCINLGLTTENDFNGDKFTEFCDALYKKNEGKLVFDNIKGLFHQNQGVGGDYGHRLDAMPFILSKKVWERFGPMLQVLNQYGTTGDTDFFDRCRTSGVEITKALDAISYHCGGAETARNMKNNVYT